MALVKDWPDPVFYMDDGISGTKGPAKRPALARLLADLRAGKYQAVIIHSLDRLGRKTSLVLELVDEFNHLGVSLVSCKEQLDTMTPQGQFVLTMFAALAQLERDLIADRTRAALAERGRRNGDKGGKLPYGYQRTEHSDVSIDRHAAHIVRRIYALHAAGVSLRKIAEQMVELGPAPRGGAWRHTGVAEILSNEALYRGAQRGESTLRWPVILAD